MAQQIKIRRDTAANWTSVDPILALGEPALETDTAKEKIGDGATAWSSLPYKGGSTVSGVIVYNVKDYGALGNGIDLEDGAITATDATFTSATAAFVAGDVGKVIAVEGAGTAGAYHVTTIASYTSATEVELTDNAVTTVTGSNFYYGTDDTDDIQTTIQTVYDAGGGIVYIPRGIYIIDGPLLNNVGVDLIDYNSQLYLPGHDVWDLERSSIEIVGEFIGNTAQSGGIGGPSTVATGSCLRSTIQGSGTFPSVIANRGASTWTIADKTFTTALFKDLNIQVTMDGSDKVTMGGINCLLSSVAIFDQVMCFPFACNFSDNSAKPDVLDVIGLAGPQNSGEHVQTMTRCYVGGFTMGYVISDHMSLNSCSAICCTTGVVFRDAGQFCGATKLVTHWCIYDIGSLYTVSNSHIYIQHLQFEISDALGNWYDHVATINDPSDYLTGKIEIAGWDYDGSQYAKIGGENLTVNFLEPVDNINLQTGTTYTPTILDTVRITKLTNASAITVTIPPYTDLNYDFGAALNFYQGGAGQVTFVGGTGVTIEPSGTLSLNAQYSACTLIKEANNTWLIVGDIV